MSLVLALGQPTDPLQCDYDRHVVLEDDGYYWYFYPAFRQAAQLTGQWIDLYDSAIFADEDLLALRAAVEGMEADLNKRPDQWDVVSGRELPGAEAVRTVVHKTRCRELLDSLLLLIDQAFEERRPLAAVGD